MAGEEPTKYKPLGEFLANLDEAEVTLTLPQLEALVGKLPDNAAKHQFWANTNHHLSRRGQWLNNGFNAYFLPDDEAVLFKRGSRTPDTAANAWSVGELRGCVAMYRKMWDLQQAQGEVKKSEWRKQALESFLAARTEGSFEYRMQNISEVLRKLGIPPLQGYLPAKNIGAKTEAIIISLVGEFWDTDSLTKIATDDPEVLAARVDAARAQLANSVPGPPPAGNDKPDKKDRNQTSYSRLASVIAFVENEAKGRCESCDMEAPFVREDGTPFLEVHHVVHLANGGPDRVDNAVALCPNCHRRLHHGNDKNTIRNALYKNIGRLRRPNG